MLVTQDPIQTKLPFSNEFLRTALTFVARHVSLYLAREHEDDKLPGQSMTAPAGGEMLDKLASQARVGRPVVELNPWLGRVGLFIAVGVAYLSNVASVAGVQRVLCRVFVRSCTSCPANKPMNSRQSSVARSTLMISPG
jgi:hypothetical protein